MIGDFFFYGCWGLFIFNFLFLFVFFEAHFEAAQGRK